MTYKKYEIFLITGGTGGHIFPAISLSEYFTSKGISNLIITDFRGSKYINQKKYSVKTISSSHLDKRNFDLIKGIAMLLIGFIQFTILLTLYKPKNIITFGSYASFTPILSTLIFKRIFKTKIFFHEQNSIIGKVHKFFLSASESIFLTFKNTKGINSKYNSVYSGFPIRNEIKKYKKNNYNFGKKTKKINFLVFGGSQAALNLSRNITDLLVKLSIKEQSLINLTIQAPKNDITNLRIKLNKTKIKYEIKTFYKDLARRISRSDICICRSGSSTVNELLYLKTPSILVPLPSSKENHQYYNAKFLSDRKAAILVEEKNILNNKTLGIINNIILKKNLLKKMFLSLRKINEMNSNDIIYKKIFSKKLYDK